MVINCLWAWKQFIQHDRLPPHRVVIRFVLTDRPRERFWLLLSRNEVEVCVKPPGLDEDVVVTTDCGSRPALAGKEAASPSQSGTSYAVNESGV